jgi:hypothetical protein
LHKVGESEEEVGKSEVERRRETRKLVHTAELIELLQLRPCRVFRDCCRGWVDDGRRRKRARKISPSGGRLDLHEVIYFQVSVGKELANTDSSSRSEATLRAMFLLTSEAFELLRKGRI